MAQSRQSADQSSTSYELVAALSLWSVIGLGVSMVPVAIAAYFIFGFNLLELGLPLAAFFAVLVLNRAGRLGISAGAIFVARLAQSRLPGRLPFYYCRSAVCTIQCRVLPDWFQPVALALPPTHVFEGMRSILLHRTFDPTALWWAILLSALYLWWPI